MKIMESFNFQTKEFDLYALANGKPPQVLQEDSNVQPVLEKDDAGGNVEDRWERLGQETHYLIIRT